MGFVISVRSMRPCWGLRSKPRSAWHVTKIWRLGVRAMSEMLSQYFSKKELECKCGCGFCAVDPDLLIHLDTIRERMAQPLKVNSCCRCEAYNKKIGGELNSAHTRGKAADIAMPGSVFRYVFLSMAYRLFRRVGIYKNFCHVDVDTSLPQNVTWIG